MFEIGNSAPGAFLIWQSGGTTLTALSDGYNPITYDTIYSVPTELGRKLDRFAFRGDNQIFSSSKFLIQAEWHKPILIDSGTGSEADSNIGVLRDSLKMAGVKPKDIGLVIMTDLHPDHSGKLIDFEGNAVYPNADLAITKAEAVFWLAEDHERQAQGNMKPLFAQVKKALAPYRNRLRLFHAGEAAPGLTAVPIPGRYPGLTGFLLQSGQDKIFIWSDPADRKLTSAGWAAAGPHGGERFTISATRKRGGVEAAERKKLAGSYQADNAAAATATAIVDRHGDFGWLTRQPWVPHRTG